MRDHIIWWLLVLIRKIKPHSSGACANRYTEELKVGAYDITITYRDTTKQDGYSREELYGMLKLIRAEERKMGWRVPEP